jgi:hypothetical protein
MRERLPSPVRGRLKRSLGRSQAGPVMRCYHSQAGALREVCGTRDHAVRSSAHLATPSRLLRQHFGASVNDSALGFKLGNGAPGPTGQGAYQPISLCWRREASPPGKRVSRKCAAPASRPGEDGPRASAKCRPECRRAKKRAGEDSFAIPPSLIAGPSDQVRGRRGGLCAVP